MVWNNLWWMLLLLAMAPLAVLRGKHNPVPLLLHTQLPLLPRARSWQAMVLLPKVFLYGAITCLVIALCGPRLEKFSQQGGVTTGRRIQIALDDSGSMGKSWQGAALERAPGGNDWLEPGEGGVVREEGELRRIDVAQAAIGRFVQWRLDHKSGDLMSWTDFDEVTRLRQPFDQNLEQMMLISQFAPTGSERSGGNGGLGMGTNFGTKPGGPIDFAAQSFSDLDKESGVTGCNVLIMVSDGEDLLTQEVQDRLVAVLTAARIHFYLISVAGDLTSAKEKSSIVKVCERVAPQHVFPVASGTMEECFRQIDKLETGPVPFAALASHEQLFHMALAAGLLFGLAWLSSEAVFHGI